MKKLKTKEEVDIFVEEKVKEVLSIIKMKDRDSINVNRKISREAIYDIRVCPAEKLILTDAWEDSEIFSKKDDNLFLYLKGRMLIQTGTTWCIGGNFIHCSYRIDNE